ncbi:MAG: histidinol dehydrogenase [Dongiaceae bacterium]
MAVRLDHASPRFDAEFAALLGVKRELQLRVDEAVAAIIDDVRTRGDAALLDYTTKFDRCRLSADRLRLTEGEIAEAARRCPATVVSSLETAATRIRDYYARLMPADLDYRDAAGLRLGALWRPLAAAGIYVPGGAAAYPSSVLMNAVPAAVAGVERLAMVVPTPDGALNPAVMKAAQIAGVTEIYRVGGAQAVAALAFGTASIAPVDKIVGPGNAYVAAAKRQVFGNVGIDMIAGPSEILVIADAGNDPAWVAMDLLSQAEHDETAQSILITDDAGFADAVAQAVASALKGLKRRDIATASWERYGAIIRVERLAEAAALANRLAPEHLELAIADPDTLLPAIRNAGAVFLGRHTPEAIGDYIAGPSHVLPTGRSARYASGLGVHDFLKRMSLIACDAESLGRLGPTAIALAEAEGLDAHARSIAIRLNPRSDA